VAEHRLIARVQRGSSSSICKSWRRQHEVVPDTDMAGHYEIEVEQR
jgi:hypothetical protein